MTPRPTPGGTTHSFWLLPLDERVVLVLAFAGTRSATDAATNALLRALAAGVSYQKVIEGSLRDSQQVSTGWWGALLQWLPWTTPRSDEQSRPEPSTAAVLGLSSSVGIPRLGSTSAFGRSTPTMTPTLHRL